MMKSILAACLCICFLATARPALAGENKKPDTEKQMAATNRPETGKIAADEIEAARMMEMLRIINMLQQLDLMEDYEIVGDDKNEKNN